MRKKYLPIGSVVLLKEANKTLMIYGRHQQESGTGEVFDYVGCLYPEGNIGTEHVYVFDADKIAHVLFVGFDNEENKALTQQLQTDLLPRLNGEMRI